MEVGDEASSAQAALAQTEKGYRPKVRRRGEGELVLEEEGDRREKGEDKEKEKEKEREDGIC